MKSKLDTSVWTTSLSALADVFVPGGLVTGHVTLITDSFVTVEVKEGVIGRVDRELMHGMLYFTIMGVAGRVWLVSTVVRKFCSLY